MFNRAFVKSFLIFSFFFVTLISQAQVIWIEDFENYANGTQQALPKWWTIAGDCDDEINPGDFPTNNGNYWGVYDVGGNKKFRVNDVEGQTCCGGAGGGNNDSFWYSDTIDISGYGTINVYASVEASSDMETTGCNSADSVVLSYKTWSGGSWSNWIDFKVFTGSIGRTVDTGCVVIGSADSLILSFMAGNQANGEDYFIDSIMVSAGLCTDLVFCPPTLTSLDHYDTLNAEDFSTCGAISWSNNTVSGSEPWGCSGGSMTINGFGGSNEEHWLIINAPIDFDAQNNEVLTFITQEQYGGPDLVLFYYSSDYVGSGDPNLATWTSLGVSFNDVSTGGSYSSPFGYSEDLSNLTGTLYLAFYYEADGTGGGSESWLLDDILIASYTYGIEDVSCAGQSDGSLDIVTTAGTSPYTFNWSTSATTEDISGLPANTYQLTVNDANMCSDTVGFYGY